MAQRGIANPPTPASVNHLELCREKGDGSRNRVNRFIRRHHPLGEVPHWVAAWSARYKDYIVAVVVLNRPGRMVDDDKEINIQRLARRDDRPANTCSWLIARARTWARLEGYERIAAHAGVAGNYGTAYEAAGFDLVDVTMADGSGWTSRPGREERDDYERRKWVDHL